MSVEAMTVVLHHSKARGNARLILLGIANHEGDGGAWPSLATLSKYAGGLDERNVRRALRALEASGELVTLRQAGGTADTPDLERTNLYRVALRCPVDCDRTTQHRTARQQRLEVAAARGGGSAPRSGGSAPTRGAAAPPTPGAAAPPEPSAEPSRNRAVPAFTTDARARGARRRPVPSIPDRTEAHVEAAERGLAAARAALNAKAKEADRG